MQTLRDLRYRVIVEHLTSGEKIHHYVHQSNESFPDIIVHMDGKYSSDGVIPPEVHEAITGTLFKMGVYQMIGKHLREHD